MTHKRKDTLAAPKEWAKHLRPFWKREHSKAERRMVRKALLKRLDKMEFFDSIQP